jgi:AcrR family transcriptional regulator
MSDTATRASATRTAIIETAERLFRTMGYQKTAVADIARELRMSPANIYRFFASKSAINEAIAERLLRDLTSHAQRIASGDGPAPDRLTALFQIMQQQSMALFFNEKRMHDMVSAALAENWNVVQRFVDTIDTLLADLVRDGQARGEFDPALDPAKAGSLVHATMLGFTHPTMIEQCMREDDLPAMARSMAEFCIRALKAENR